MLELSLYLSQIGFVVFEPSTAARDDFQSCAQVQQVAFVTDAVGMHHVELGQAERRRNFVLDDLATHALADDFFAFFQAADASNIDAARRVELQSAPPGWFRDCRTSRRPFRESGL